MSCSWKVLERHTEFSVPNRLDLVREVVRLPDGRIVRDFYKVVLRPFVLVIAETADQMVVCLEQYRHGPARIVLTLPGGGIEDAEDVGAAARRELVEETGFVVDDLRAIGTFQTAANQGGSHCTVFRAANARQIMQPKSGDLEEAQVRLLSHRDLLMAVREGAAGTGGDLAAIALLLADGAVS